MRSIPLLLAASLAVLTLATGPAVAQTTSTPFTLSSGTPRTPEQLAMRFDLADLAIRVLPEEEAIDAIAALTFTATMPIDALVVELDTRFALTSIQIDGIEVDDEHWSNPDGRLTVRLTRALSTGESATLRIAYGGQPHQASNAPWDGGFVWSKTPDGKPWIGTALQGEGCDLFWPCIDHPQGEPARVDMHITVPSDLSAPANGRFLGKIDNGDGTAT